MDVLETVWEFLGRNGANVIASCALLFTAYEVFATRRHNHLSVRPHIATRVERVPISQSGTTKVTWSLVNHGLGPALIKGYSVFLDGELFDTGSPSTGLQALKKAFGTIPPSFYIGNLVSDYLMKTEEVHNILKVELPTPPLDKITKLSDIDEFDAGIKHFKVVVKYASLYGDEFIFESDRA